MRLMILISGTHRILTHKPKPMNETETLAAFFEYLDSLSKSELDADSLTGHGRNFLETIKIENE